MLVKAPRGRRPSRLASRADRLAVADFDVIEALQAFATERELSMLQVAVGGLAAMPAVGSVIAGATSVEQVRQNVAAGLWQPTAEDLDELRRLTAS